MPYQIRRAAAAKHDIRDFFRYLKREAGVTVATSYLEALDYDLTQLIANMPNAFNWFHETGAPYRAKLFKTAKTTYWIIYVVDEVNQVVEFVRFWNCARRPDTHGLPRADLGAGGNGA